jgi:hypothetical protein
MSFLSFMKGFSYQDYIGRSGGLAAERSQIPSTGYVVYGIAQYGTFQTKLKGNKPGSQI